MPIDKAAKSGDVALAGPDGQRLGLLIDRSETKGADLLYRLTKTALTRILSGGVHAAIIAPDLFNAAESQEFINYMAAVVATGDLLGRSRMREKMRKAEATRGLDRFAEGTETPWAFLPDTLPILPPEQAIRYFGSLIPTIGVDPVRYGQAMQRAAFTLANVTERTILSKVQELILSRLAGGNQYQTAPHDIESILTDAGLSPTNPQYGQMVWRTNAMDAYNVGGYHELDQNPEVKEFFPAWQYLGIRDGREGDDHRPRFNRYYPNTLSFHFVRGPRVFNCRCTPRYIDRYEWARLLRQGAAFSNV